MLNHKAEKVNSSRQVVDKVVKVLQVRNINKRIRLKRNLIPINESD